MTVQYITDTKGKKTGVLLGIKDWEIIQKKLNSEEFYEGFKASLDEIALHNRGKTKLKDAKDLFK